MLRTVDRLWVEHLTEIDDMRRGIGLRGYAQQDPLNEFRKEAFRLYEELSGFIHHQVAASIFRVTVTRQAPQPSGAVDLPGPGQPARPGAPGEAGAPASLRPPAPASLTAGRGALRAPGAAGAPIAGLPADPMRGAREASGAGSGAAGTRPGYTPSGTRIGRNDPCWCGSGQKYKKCHGV